MNGKLGGWVTDELMGTLSMHDPLLECGNFRASMVDSRVTTPTLLVFHKVNLLQLKMLNT